MAIFRTASSTVLAAMALAAPAAAAPGDLDPSFGEQGVFQRDLSSSGLDSGSTALLALPGDRLLAAGWSAGRSEAVAVGRHLESGALDRSFGSEGIAAAELDPCPDAYLNGFPAATVGPDDRIVVVGTAVVETDDSEETRAVVTVFTKGGQRDPAFGEGGTLCQLHGTSSSLDDVLVQPDGKIVVAGAAIDENGRVQALVVRYLSDGRRDGSFGVDGAVQRQYGTAGSSAAAIRRQPDGALLLGGTVTDGDGREFALVARLMDDGAPDATFGTRADGSVRLPLEHAGPGRGVAYDLGLDAQQHVVVAGQESSGPNEAARAVLARLEPDGDLDGQFGASGVTRVEAGLGSPPIAGFRALAFQADGKIVAAGFALDQLDRRGALLSRFDAAGRPDTGFGTAGAVRTQHGFGDVPYSQWTAIALDSSGRIAAAGPAFGMTDDEQLPHRWTVARFISGAKAVALPPRPPDTPSTPKLRLPSSATVNRRGVVRLRVSCTSAVACRGTLTLRRNRVRLARAALTVAAGARRTVNVRLDAAGRRLLRRHARVTVRATSTLRRTSQPALVVVQTLRLRRLTAAT
ncbi:hypothetical protein OJ998_27150 [Solirubrobacter taibaiensis]|nr:hypothetical protein [Solirubrobacter taibaiensis]